MGDRKSIRAGWAGLDLQTHLSNVGKQGMGSFPGAYVDGWNFVLHAGPEGNATIPRKFKGTRSIPWAAPAGDNTCIGTYWDETGDSLIAFIHNSNGDHCILRYFPAEAQARVMVIPPLNLSLGNPVVGCVLVNSELLAFCDGMEGDYPKMIDIKRADDYNKRLVLRLYLPQASGLVDFREFRVRPVASGVLGATVGPPAFANATTRQVRDFRPMVSHFASQWNNIPALSSVFTAKGCGEYVELTALNPGDNFARVEVTDYIGGIAQLPETCVVEKWNAYNEAWHFAQVRLSREKPITPPTVEMGTDATRKSNLLKNKLFQFMYAFHLHNKEQTLRSPISDIALPSSGSCTSGAASSPNYIDVGFAGDKWLNDPALRGEVEVVDILVREGNDGAWFLAESLEKWEWMYNRSYRFFNDGVLVPTDDPFAEASMTFVPPRANGMEGFNDADDNQRLLTGGIKEGDDNPCIDITFDVELSESPTQARLVDITGRVVVMGVFDPNPAVFGTQHYNFNQPIWTYNSTTGPVYGGFGISAGPLVEFFTNDPQTWGQRIPMGGFTVYVAGTDRYDTTRQTNFPATVTGGTVNATLWAPPQDHPATGRNVYDGSVRGYSLTPTNRTHRDAIRSMIEDDHVYSTFTIPGLERGKTYVIRIASNLVDILDDGSIYDLNNSNLDWQRTSTRTVQVGSNDALVNPSGGTYPAGTIIESGRTECRVTIPLTGPAVIDIGNCVVMDTTNPNPIDGSFVIDGYLFDNLGADYSASNDVRTLGISAEKQLVRLLNHGVGPIYDPFSNPSFNLLYLAPFLWPALGPTIIYNTFIQQLFGLGTGFPGDYRTYSDHNGYWFFFNKNQVGHSPQAQWCGVTGNPSNPIGQVTATNNPNGTQFYQILNDFDASKWEGGANGALEGALNPISGNLFNGPGWKQYVFANLLATLTHRTHVKALIQDSGTGNGVAGMTALMQNGRTAESDADGIVNLVVFGDVIENLNRRYVDELMLYNNTACTVTFLGGNTRVVNIDQFTPGGDYSESPDTNWFDLHFIVPIMVTVIPVRAGCLSRGGTYSIGGAYGRWDGSGTAVKEFATLRIPNLGEDLTIFDPLQWPPATFPGGLWSSGFASVRWTINGPVEIPWAGRWEYLQLYMTKDGTRDFQLQWVAGEVTYSTAWKPATSEPTATSYSSGTATEVYIVLTDTLDRYKDLNSSSTLGYLWQSGDRLRIISDASGGQVFSVMEYEISGQRFPSGQVGKWIVLKADNSMPQISAGMRMEIFRPALAEDDAEGKDFYAIPGGLVLVDDPYGPVPTWSVPTGVIDRWDTWLIPTKVPFRASNAAPWGSKAMVRESKSYSDFFASRSWGRGKVLFPDPDAQIQERGSFIRYSGSYKPGTSINGLNLFAGLDFRDLENWLGVIRKMVDIGDVILCIADNGCVSVYKSKEPLETGADGIVMLSGKILNAVRSHEFKFGTQHPMSVVRGTTTVLWFDVRNGAIVQYGSNQLQDMAWQNNCAPYFQTMALSLEPGTVVCGGLDMAHREFIFSFHAHGTTIAQSMKFHDPSNNFTAKLGFAPDAWGRTRQRLYSFANGGLWEHHSTDRYNEVYGQNMPMSISTPFVPEEWLVLTWKAFSVRLRGAGWEASMAWNIEGQQTRVPAEVIAEGVKEGWYGFSLMRDQNDPDPNVSDPLNNGQQMRSPEIVLELRNGRNGDAQLIALNAKLSESPVEP
jgi:hypothetical protein